MSNYGVRELTWENGQLTVHGLGGLLHPNASAKPIWTESLSGCETLESVVHQAALNSKLQTHDGRNHDPDGKNGPVSRKRPHSDADLWFQEESLGSGQSVSASPSLRTNDTRTMSWASFESCRSLKTVRTGDKDNVRSGSETQDTEGEEQETKEETGRSYSRRGRAAAIHNESERRRRDRINQRMKTLQKLLPNGTKADKVSILDEVIEHLKHLQAQVQFMTMRPNLPQQMMMPPLPQPPQSVLSMQQQQQQQQQQQFQMALLTTMARMGMGTGGVFGGGFVPPPKLMVPPMANNDCNSGSSAPVSDPYSAFVAQTMNMDLYNKMAAAMYKQQSDQSTQVTTSIPSQTLNHKQGD